MQFKVDVVPLICADLISGSGLTDEGEPVAFLDKDKLKKILGTNYFELVYVQLHGERFSKCDPGQWIVAYKIDNDGEILVSLYSPEINKYLRWFYILNEEMAGYEEAVSTLLSYCQQYA